MITARSESARYLAVITNGRHELLADAPSDKGGQGAGFRPHELLEAALASCLNMWLRVYAHNHGLPLERLTTTVCVQRERPEETTFEYRIELHGDLTDEQRDKLMRVAETCSVRQSLSRKLTFRPAAPEEMRG